jgi:hypothetical protein
MRRQLRPLAGGCPQDWSRGRRSLVKIRASRSLGGSFRRRFQRSRPQNNDEVPFREVWAVCASDGLISNPAGRDRSDDRSAGGIRLARCLARVLSKFVAVSMTNSSSRDGTPARRDSPLTPSSRKERRGVPRCWHRGQHVGHGLRREHALLFYVAECRLEVSKSPARPALASLGVGPRMPGTRPAGRADRGKDAGLGLGGCRRLLYGRASESIAETLHEWSTKIRRRRRCWRFDGAGQERSKPIRGKGPWS